MNFLKLKHLLATSRAAPFLSSIRRFLNLRRSLSHPELGLLRQEDNYIDHCISKLVQPGDNCIDVGAHIGSVSYALVQRSPGGRHFVFEPHPVKCGWLQKRFAGAEVIEAAVSDSAGTVSFFDNLDRPGFSSLASRASRGREQEITVQTVRLDDAIPADLPVHFIKVDVEGFEYEAISGARSLLERCRPKILFEAGADKDSDVDGEKYLKLFDMLTQELGYEIMPVFHFVHGKGAIDPRAFVQMRSYPFLAFNYLAIPRPEG